MFQQFLWVALGGACGASARFGVSLLAVRLWGASFPWGTFSVNMLGSLFMGVVFALVQGKWLPPAAQSFVAIGFLGSFTTFSSFALDNLKLMQNSHTLGWMGNLIVQNILGLVLVWLGWRIGHMLVG